jgi:diguanylate cyclase (GGDEF)-like protein
MTVGSGMSSEAQVSSSGSGADPAAERRAPFGIADWPVWSLPSRVRLPVLLVELTAVMLTVLLARGLVVDSREWFVAGVLTAIGLAHTEVAVRVERTRRRVTEELHVDLTSVWTFAGALLLPATLAAGVAIVVHGYVWWRSWRPRVPLYRQVFSTATVVLACVGAAAAVADIGDPGPGFSALDDLWAALVAMLVYTTVNSCLVAGAIAVSVDRPDLGRVFGHWNENALELATLSLGALTAVATSIHPLLVLFVLPPLLVLHRAVLVRHLEEAARTDVKTGLLNAAAWHAQAERELRRVRRTDGPRGVLVLDLDHFKAVNDAHGHIVGDEVLHAVATALKDEVRERDLAGRFGGEEFVVLLAGRDRAAGGDVQAVAERIRRRVEGLQVPIDTPDGPLTVDGLTVSVGGAVSAPGSADLQTLLQTADAALYAAKRAGRNRVRMGVTAPGLTLPAAPGDPAREADPPPATHGTGHHSDRSVDGA